MQRFTGILVLAGAALTASAAQADWWFWRSADQVMGPTYRLPTGFYGGADFYYDYLGYRVPMPWWVPAYNDSHRYWTGSLYTPFKEEIRPGVAGEEVVPAGNGMKTSKKAKNGKAHGKAKNGKARTNGKAKEYYEEETNGRTKKPAIKPVEPKPEETDDIFKPETR